MFHVLDWLLYVLDWCVVCTGLMYCMYWTDVLYICNASACSMGRYILNPKDALRYAEYACRLVEGERGLGATIARLRRSNGEQY